MASPDPAEAIFGKPDLASDYKELLPFPEVFFNN